MRKTKAPTIWPSKPRPQKQLQLAAQARAKDRERLAVDPLESIFLDGPDKSTYVSSLLSSGEKEHIQQVLLRNMDVFSWTHSDMTVINPVHASHKMNVIPKAKTVRQKVRHFHLDHNQVIQEEVDNLLKARFIKEIKYPEWLANVVIVPKKGEKWRVCMDYTDLNEACPKDNFSLPRIDQIVNTSAGHGMLSFLDSFSGYHQIPMHPLDAEKTAFITLHGMFCYNVMSFGLKNVGATYQRLVTKMFRSLLGNTMEVYIDDMLVKSKERLDHADTCKRLLNSYGHTV